MYKVDRTKNVSPLKKYEYLQRMGVVIALSSDGLIHTGHAMRGSELDDYINRALWIEAHPGESPYELPPKRESTSGGASSEAGEETGDSLPEG